jgi:osmotically-inducible protein OsmY
MRVLLALAVMAGLAFAAPARTDAEIEADIKARMAKSKIAANNFQVKVRGGTATLTGKTDIVQHKGVATRLAKNAGAAQVVNNIEIGGAARQQAADRLVNARKSVAADAPKPAAAKAEQAPPPVRRAVVKH